MNSEARTKDVLTLMRLPIVIVITVAYNICAILAFWKFGATMLVFSGVGYSIFVVLLMLRYSTVIQRWVLKRDSDLEHFIKLLSFPLWLWGILPSVALVASLFGIVR